MLCLSTYAQLEQLGRPQLKTRSMNLRDRVGEKSLPPLLQGGNQQQLINWIITSQVMIMKASGRDCSAADFGLPIDCGQPEGNYFGRSQPAANQGTQEVP